MASEIDNSTEVDLHEIKEILNQLAITIVNVNPEQGTNDGNVPFSSDNISVFLPLLRKLDKYTSKHHTNGNNIDYKQNIINFVVPNLFKSITEDNDIALHNPNVALSILTLLVTYDENTYLSPTSQYVKTYVQNMTSSPESSSILHLSSSLIQTILYQMISPSTSVADNASQTIITLCAYYPDIHDKVISVLTQLWGQLVTQLHNHETMQHSQTTKSIQDKGALSTYTVRYASLLVSLLSDPHQTSSSTNNTLNNLDKIFELSLQYSSLDLLLELIQPSREEDEDPLLQLSMLDLMEQMATSLPMNHKREKWLCSSRVVPILLSFLIGQNHTEKIIENLNNRTLNGNLGKNNKDLFGMDDKSNETITHPLLGGAALRILASICKLSFMHQYQDNDNHNYNAEGSSRNTIIEQDHPNYEQNNMEQHGGHHIILHGFHFALHVFTHHVYSEVDKIALIDAISSFASTSSHALNLILDDETLRKSWLNLSQATQTKFKCVIIGSISIVVEAMSSPSSSPSHSDIIKLYSSLGAANNSMDPNQLFMSFIKSPFVEIRLCAYKLLYDIINNSKNLGAQLLLFSDSNSNSMQERSSTSGSMERIVDIIIHRENEPCREGKEMKYEIIQLIVETRQILNVLGSATAQKMDNIVNKEGLSYFMGTSSRFDVSLE